MIREGCLVEIHPYEAAPGPKNGLLGVVASDPHSGATPMAQGPDPELHTRLASLGLQDTR